MKTNEIHIRDPFVLKDGGKYYMTGTIGATTWGGRPNGFDAWVSEDLENWEGPIPIFRPGPDFWADRQFWAAEMHVYNGAYYLFASFKSDDHARGTQIMKADNPLGPYELMTEFPVTPSDWECLDGTLYVENGVPYMVFCHEWLQVKDGEIHAMPLTADLKEAAGEPVLLFRASEAPWNKQEDENHVTDGPFMYKTQNGKLLMLWSTHGYEGYAIGYAESEGGILGPWHQVKDPLFKKDGGHGMIFEGPDGKLLLSIHQPNNTPDERPLFLEITDTGDAITAKN